MATIQFAVPPEVKRIGRRFGYAVAVVVNVMILIVVQHILAWGWLPFLTEEFADVVPLISLSLVASILANLVYQFNDSTTVKSPTQILVNLISLFVTSQVLMVFPFDFTGYAFNWDVVVRFVLILAMVGAGIGALTEAVKFASSESDKKRR